MKTYPPSPKMVKMNYKQAATTPLCPKKSIIKMQQEPDEEQLKMIEKEEFHKRASFHMKKIVDRFLNYKRDELKLEGYNDEEIESIIEHLLNPEDDEYLDYSSNEDDDSVYSDEDTF